jgi:hypothetical protein
MFGPLRFRKATATERPATNTNVNTEKKEERASMFANLISDLKAQLAFPPRLPRFATQLAAALAVAGLVLGTAPQAAPAEAAVNANAGRYHVNFTRLECVSESSELGSDEPYVVFFVGNLSNPAGGSSVKYTGVFGSVDSGDDRYQTVRLWGSATTGAVMPGQNPDNLIVLAQVMEHDNSSVGSIESKLQAELPTQLALYKAAGLTRSQIVTALKGDMFDLMGQVAEATDGITDNADERVGRPQELRITSANLSAAATGTTIGKTLQVADGGDGTYRLYFELRRG